MGFRDIARDEAAEHPSFAPKDRVHDAPVVSTV